MADDRELAELKREVSTLQDRLKERQAPSAKEVAQQMMEMGGLDTKMGRRQAMLVGALGGTAGLAALSAASQPAQADAIPADVGTEADPWEKVWAHAIESGDGADFLTLGDAIQQANEAVSSATTIGNVCYIEVDTTVASLTVTIPASLEASGIELRFLDAGGNAGSDSFDVTSTNWNIDGSGTATVDVSDTAFVLYSAGDRWVSHRFIQRVDAGTVATEDLTFGTSGQLFNEETDGVSTSATTILTIGPSSFPPATGAKVIVTGLLQGDDTTRFADEVNFFRWDSPSATEINQNGNPDGRTYTRANLNELQLAMASNTYNVGAAAWSTSQNGA